MSRHLPTRPNLEHLRKQGKDLLERMRHADPSIQLADAQHALAMDYGFASWPRLRAHIEHLSEVRQVSPLNGRWAADLTRSRPHPDNPWQTATIVVEVDGADVRITDTVVDASGREEHHVNTIVADGIERASDNGYSLLATWRDGRTLETVGRKDGAVVGSAIYAVSDDGNTLTISADQQFVVLSRTDSPAV
jgi:hypothetical protein